MGRGGRSDNQALRVRALPRLLAKPQELGQRRYIVERRDRNGDYHREPGYGRNIYEYLRVNGNNEVGVREEIAVEGGDGNLHWLPTRHRVFRNEMYRFNSLTDARHFADHLDKNPLGPLITREVDTDGKVLIGYGRRQVNRDPFHLPRMPKGELTVIDYQPGSEPQKFDVSDPVEAEKAKQYYQQLENRLAGDRLSEADRYLNEALDSPLSVDSEKARKILAKEEGGERVNSEKIAQAEQFIDSLEKGNSEEIIDQIEAQHEQEEAADQQRVAARAKETLRSLGRL